MVVWRILLFQWLLLHGLEAAPSVPNPNVALLKPASQSSTDGSSVASKAVSGDTTRLITLNLCSKTVVSNNSNTWHWWMVDLQEVFTIESVVLTSARSGDGKDIRLSNFSIEISVENPINLTGFPGKTGVDVCMSRSDPVPYFFPVAYACDHSVTGRYIRIVKSNSNYKPLYLCEFEAYTYLQRNLTTELPLKDNLALGKPASQSSTMAGYVASLAVDGDLSTYFDLASCTHTSGGTSWWMVDLEYLYLIDSIRISSRSDCCQNRLHNFTVEVSVEHPSHLDGFPGITTKGSEVCHKQTEIVSYHAPATYSCNRPVVWRYVRVILNRGPLTLCEFEVLGRSLTAMSRGFVLVARRQTDASKTSPVQQYLMIRCLKQHFPSIKFVRFDFNSGACSFHLTLADSYAEELSSDNNSNDNMVIYEIMN